jgi:hypothetical protein
LKKAPFIIQLQTAPPDRGYCRKIMIITCGVSNKQLVRKSTAHTSNVQTSHQVADSCLYYQYTPPHVHSSKKARLSSSLVLTLQDCPISAPMVSIFSASTLKSLKKFHSRAHLLKKEYLPRL